jgi:transcriptional regulator with XRE-family HTH domain
MFEIGSTLREARTRRGLTLRDAHDATRIRSNHLAALEDERFDELPEEVYVKGFLRAYADYLGLDGELFVAEFNSRLEANRPPPPPESEPRLALPALNMRAALLGTACAIALAAGVLAWRYASGSEGGGASTASSGSTVRANASAPPVQPTRERATGGIRLVLTAARGDCWLSVRKGSREGRLLYEGMLLDGESLRFVSKRLWVRMGAPWNLRARLNGRAVTGLPVDTGNVVVTRAGLRPA